MIGVKFGRYLTIKALGSGAMGHVYEAIEEPLGRRVALKVLDQSHASDPHLRARFQNEVRAASEISHPGAVSIYALDETPAGVPFLVMELLVGETLRERMRREGSLSWSVVLGIARQLASTLRQAHKNGVVHRDVKPANIMLTSDPEAPGSVRTKLLDFGIAKLPALEDAAITSVRTASGMVMGTPEYMSPEQCRDGAAADGRADVYALATTLFHALTGQLPIGGVGLRADALLYAHMHHEPRLLRALCPELPPEVSVLWQRMLAKDPAARPTMAEVVDALRTFPEQTATTELALRPGQTVRSYRVLRLLCVGPRGAFFDAVHLDSDAVHAIIKVPSAAQGKDEHAVAQLRAEARALMTQVDPGIVKILDFGHLLGGLPYVIMEHLPARTLRSECDFMAEQRQRHGAARLRLEQQAMAVRVVRQLAATLEVGAANAPGLALQPEGLLVVPSQAHHAEPLVKALDLGLGETLAGLPPAAAHKSAEEVERAQVQRLSDLLQELLVGAAKDGRRPALGSRPLQALVARMQDPRGERRPRLAEVIVALDRLQATTLLERRGGLSRVTAALGLLILALGCALAAVRLLPRDAPPTAEAGAAAQRPVPAVVKAAETAEAAEGERLLHAPVKVLTAPPATLKPRDERRSRRRHGGAPRTVALTSASGALSLHLAVSAGGAVTWSAADHTGSCTAQACDTAPLPAGATVSLKAQPASGWYLQGWGDDAEECADAASCALTLGAEDTSSVAARFERLVPLRLSHSGEGDLAPLEAGEACGDARCYRPGQQVHIQARPRGAAVLRGWNQPADCKQQNPCELTIPRADELRVAATFAVPPGVVKLEVVGCGCIEMSPKHADPFCQGSYQRAEPQGSEITLKVARGTDPEACHFSAWDPRGPCPRADSEQCHLRVGATQHVRAVFTATSKGGGQSPMVNPVQPAIPPSNKYPANRVN